MRERERGDTGAASLVGAQVGEDLAGGLRLFGQDELEMMAQGSFDGHDILIGHADLIRQRAEHVLGLLEGGERAGAEAFVAGLQLFEDVEPGTFLRLLLQHLVLFLGSAV